MSIFGIQADLLIAVQGGFLGKKPTARAPLVYANSEAATTVPVFLGAEASQQTIIMRCARRTPNVVGARPALKRIATNSCAHGEGGSLFPARSALARAYFFWGPLAIKPSALPGDHYFGRALSLSMTRFNSSSFCPASPSLPSAVRRS